MLMIFEDGTFKKWLAESSVITRLDQLINMAHLKNGFSTEVSQALSSYAMLVDDRGKVLTRGQQDPSSPSWSS